MIYKELQQQRSGHNETYRPATQDLRRTQSSQQHNVSVSDMTEEERLKNVVPSDPNITPHMVTFAQDLVSGDLSEELFG